MKGTDEETGEECLGIKTSCILNHICYKYASIVMSGLIEALNYFAGNQGSKVLRRILARDIPVQLMEALQIDLSELKELSRDDLIKTLPELIKSKGGPKLHIEFIGDNIIKFELDECHFLPYSKTKGFCNVTAGLMLGLAQMLTGKHMDIKEIKTIAHGGDKCEFIAKPKFER